ncbi:MAG: SpoIIE family protein phosphatase [Lachnospiraceae bacterium]|nr:SpoIIE family protein phosphatase [Lachnospiraceae bacterium]
MEKEELMKELEHLQRQLAMTVSLKFHLMPDQYPFFPDLDQIDIYGDQISLAKVGGDYFDFFRIDNDHIGIVVADIFDGGDAAALYMIAFKLYLSGELSMGFTPAELIGVVNNRLAAANEDNLCLSAWYGVYELSTGIITAVNAGHEPPILARAGGAGRCENESSSYLLAVMENISYESYEIRLNPGDRLLLYTDGVTKAGFTEEMMQETLKRCEEENAEEIVGTLQDDFFEFVGDAKLKDDATFLCVKRGGES